MAMAAAVGYNKSGAVNLRVTQQHFSYFRLMPHSNEQPSPPFA